MANQTHPQTADEVADKVLRRAQVSKMTRALRDRLALAHNKIQHGSHNSVDSLPASFFGDMKRKRSDSNNDIFSDTSSSVSAQCFSTGMPASSPMSVPIFSDDIRIRSSRSSAHKRPRSSAPSFVHPSQTQHRNKARGTRSTQNTWKNTYSLPQSSPIRHHQNLQHPSLRQHQQPSFTSQVSTILDSPSASEDDDQDLPLNSFQIFPDQSNIPSSPPRTPSPSFSRSASLRGKAFSTSSHDSRYAGKEGANLLLYLASSPSPAPKLLKTPVVPPPSTPPSKQTPLPSSMMSPPGHTYFGFGNTTPNTAFNFADFVNVTPSPRWPRTPVARTPLTRSTRQMMPPPMASPNFHSRATKGAGLGMELGGALH